MSRKIIIASIMLTLILFVGSGVWFVERINIWGVALADAKNTSKIVYVQERADGYELLVSDNNANRTNRTVLLSHKNMLGFDDASYFSLGGAFLKDKILYYSDLDHQAILSYDITTNVRKQLLAKALYPFYIDNADSVIVFSTNLKNESIKSFKIYNIKEDRFREISFDRGYNTFVRPTRLINQRYIIFDYLTGYAETNSGYFLYDLKMDEVVGEYDTQNWIAMFKDQIAYLSSRGEGITVDRKSSNTLSIWEIGNTEPKEVFHNSKMDIQYITFESNGEIIEMKGDLAVAKSLSELEPYVTEPVTIFVNLKNRKISWVKGHKELPLVEPIFNSSNVIGVYNPNLKSEQK